MKQVAPVDYQSYQKIMDELLMPISGRHLDARTIKRLYESKLVYLENLRRKCFMDMNQEFPFEDNDCLFSPEDYHLILQAIKATHFHMRDLILLNLSKALEEHQQL